MKCRNLYPLAAFLTLITLPAISETRPKTSGDAAGRIAVTLVDLLRPSLQSRVPEGTLGVFVDSVPRFRTAQGSVALSSGLISLIERLSAARAAEKVQPGFFQRYVLSLDNNFQEFQAVIWPSVQRRGDVVENEKLSNFNQMTAGLLAFEFAHHYLGHYRSHRDSSTPAIPTKAATFTVEEWEESLRSATSHALSSGFATEGLKAFFEALEFRRDRPAWASAFVPPGISIARVKLLLDRCERDYFGTEDKR